MKLEELLEQCSALTLVDSRSLDLFRSPQAEVGSTGLNWAPAEGKANPSRSTQSWYLLGKGEQDGKNMAQLSSAVWSCWNGCSPSPARGRHRGMVI